MFTKIHFYLLSAFTFAFSAQSAWACSCAQKNSVKKEIESVHTVFTGTVIKISENVITEGNQSYTLTYSYTMAVETLYKGNKTVDTITVESGGGGGDCGYPFALGKKYIVYANLINPSAKESSNPFKFKTQTFYTGICHRTRPFDTEEISEIESYLKKN